MNKSVSVFVLVLMSCFAIGCAAPQQRLATESGNPEIVINGTSKKQIIDLLVSSTLGRGFQVKTVNDYSLVVTKSIDDFSVKVAYGSNYNRTPEMRLTYNFVDVSGGVKIFARSEIVTNPNSQYESTNDFTSTWGEQAQNQLTSLKAMLEKK